MDHRGLGAVAGAVTLVLERSWRTGLIEGVTPEFKAHRSRDLADPMTTGLSVLTHLVTHAPDLRRAPRPDPRAGAGVSLQAHFLLIAWAASAQVEQMLLGWGACALAEQPVLDAGLLNEAVPGVCDPGETVEIHSDAGRSVKELWQVLPVPVQPSLPYVTSAVHLRATVTSGDPASAPP